MFNWLANAWRVPELRNRIVFTAMVLALYRLGTWVPAPGVNSSSVSSYLGGQGGTILGLLNLFSGGALGLGKIGRSAEHEESPQLAGMLRKVRHLVSIEPVGKK